MCWVQPLIYTYVHILFTFKLHPSKKSNKIILIVCFILAQIISVLLYSGAVPTQPSVSYKSKINTHTLHCRT